MILTCPSASLSRLALRSSPAARGNYTGIPFSAEVLPLQASARAREGVQGGLEGGPSVETRRTEGGEKGIQGRCGN